ncbi:MAG: hypothetical protein JXQ29_07730 [Planctomycetes bacterium]|nr:hypothetical protein [Planctomycetota bacterium]
MSFASTRRASFLAGLLVCARWLGRGRAPWSVLVAALLAVGLAALAPGGPYARHAAWIELLNVVAPLLSIWVAAHGFVALRDARRVGPLEGLPLRPGEYVLGKAAALAGAIAAAVAVMVLAGVPVHGERVRPVVVVGPPAVEGVRHRLEGKDWALARRGRLVWVLPEAPFDEGLFETRLAMFCYGGFDGGPIRVRLEGAGLDRSLEAAPEVALRVPLPPGFRGGRLVLGCESPGVAVAAGEDATVLESGRPCAAMSGALELWWMVTSKCLVLAAAALAAALLVSPPVALLAALTLWVVSWTARFLGEYAELAGRPSIFVAWAGEPGEPEVVTPWLVWLGGLLRSIPDLRGAGVLDPLGRGRLVEWSRVLAETLPQLALAAGLVGAGALLGIALWRRRPGRIPGEGGVS